MDLDQFLMRIPKVELHCHLEGTMRAQTFIELAKKHSVPIPTEDPFHIYQFSLARFFEVYWLMCRTMRDREDFARVAYEALEDGFRVANLRYREMFFNPTLHFPSGIDYSTMIDGIVEGIRAAESDFGVKCRLIPAINRTEGPQAGLEMVREVVGHRRDEVIGIGMDGVETMGPPEDFVQAYAEAKRAGLHRTAHVCEGGPPKNVLACLDVLDCDRLDHGYGILDDPTIVARARDQGVFFNVKVHALGTCTAHHPVRAMIDQGLQVTFNTDDPGMQPSNLGLEFIDAAVRLGVDVGTLRQVCLNGVEAAWLDDEERREMRREFTAELDALGGELESEPITAEAT